MPEFFNSLMWQQFREQIEADFEVITRAVLQSVPALYWRYEFVSNSTTPLYVYAAYKNQENNQKAPLVLAVFMRLHTEGNFLEVYSYLDGDVEDSQTIPPDLPNGPNMIIPLPSLTDKSQSEIEALFDSPPIVSELNNMMIPTRSFIKSEEVIRAIITEETSR